ncbi:MAG: tripartite tricarboxylate transporter substrate binding protein [Betaproteobacteria bacterium]|nr:tripartite tricarboxylate transporter substrate binding protein [Betaproteobacteria bacterium]
MKDKFGLQVLIALFGIVSQFALAQSYPVRPIRLVIGTSPGGGSDIIFRDLARKLSAALGQQVVADNRPGASGIVAAGLVVQSAPDGYTLLTATTTLAINPSIYIKMPYDTMRDLAPISRIAEAPILLVVHPSVPAKNVKELIALAKARPGGLNVAAPGQGSISVMAEELFKIMAGVDMLQVPFNGAGQAILSVLSGEGAVMFPTPVSVMMHLKNGRLRALGVTGKERIQAVPELPTIAEAGLPGYEAVQWYGLLAPAGTPRPIIDRLNQEIVRAIQAPDMKARLMAGGTNVVGSTPEEYAAYIKSETGKWGTVIRKAGIKQR